MLMRALKSFPFSRNGVRTEMAEAGADVDVPDDLVPGLKREGYLEDPPPLAPPPTAVPIPDDWAAGNADAVKALAARITGEEPPRTRAEAEAIVKAEIERRAAAA